MEWKVFHDYYRLVRRGQAAPLTCPTCNTEMGLRLGPDDEPMLKCYYCNALTLPGQNLYDEINAVVIERMG